MTLFVQGRSVVASNEKPVESKQGTVSLGSKDVCVVKSIVSRIAS